MFCFWKLLLARVITLTELKNIQDQNQKKKGLVQSFSLLLLLGPDKADHWSRYQLLRAEENFSSKVDKLPNNEKIIKSISVLNRTRESLSASGCLSDSEGQLLEKALAKQLSIRKGELDSSIPNSISVIVRASTPNPEAACEENCSRRFFSTPARSPNPDPSSFAPEDYSLPLRTFLQELPEECSDLQPCRELVIVHSARSVLKVAETFENSPLAPTVP